MLLIRCPWCGDRDEIEFRYGGQALTDDEWADYLFMRDNPKGPWAERWMHAAGCRRWFNAIRDTATHRMIETYPMGEGPRA